MSNIPYCRTLLTSDQSFLANFLRPLWHDIVITISHGNSKWQLSTALSKRWWYSGEHSCFPSSWPGFDSRPTQFCWLYAFLSVLNYKKFNTTGISPHNVQLFGFVTCCVVASSISTIGLERGGWVRLTNNIDRPTKPSLLLTKLTNKLSGK